MPESRYGAPELGVGAVLRGAFREGSGAGRRVGLGCVQKGVPSRLYGRVPDGSNEGLRNLTDGLTEPLTSRLTSCLPRGLTE